MPSAASSAGATGGVPAVVLSTAAAQGVASTFLRDDDTLIAFDVTVPVTQASGDAAATGSAAVAARRDHKHGIPTLAPALAIPEILLPMASVGATVAASVDAANDALLIPLPPLTANVTVSNVMFYQAVQSGNFDIGIYSWNGSTFTRIASLGTTAAPVGASVFQYALSASLVAGTRYFLAFAADNGVESIYKINYIPVGVPFNNAMGYKKAASFPLPSSIATPTQYSSPLPYIIAQCAQLN